MTTSCAMMPVFFAPMRSTSRPSTMRRIAPERIGTATMKPFCSGAKVQRLADLRAERAEHRPDHEAEVEVEERGEQGGPVAGAFEIGEFQVVGLLVGVNAPALLAGAPEPLALRVPAFRHPPLEYSS